MISQRYLQLLAKDFPNVESATAEIIQLSAMNELPKGTEYFFSDIHGEADAFLYQLKTASGVIRRKIDDLFSSSLEEAQRLLLGELVYHPSRVLELQRIVGIDQTWYNTQIIRLVAVLKTVASKRTRKTVRLLMPEKYALILDELLHGDTEDSREAYATAITEAVITAGVADDFITRLCGLIQKCAIHRLHIIGDIFDRGPHPDQALDALMLYPNVDIQWGNHDMHWMGAACGNACCVASVIRLAMSYNHFDLIQDAYGINLRPLFSFAQTVYGDDPCISFFPHRLDANLYDRLDDLQVARMHKAIAVIQFKLEGQLILRHPEYQMDKRNLLPHVNIVDGTVVVEGETYFLRDNNFPTLNAKNPLALTAEEEELINTLSRSFSHSPLLQRHLRFLFEKGSLYLIRNGNLLFHGCIPLNENGNFTAISLDGKTLSGRALLDEMESIVRKAYYAPTGSKTQMHASDFMWYLWCGERSPLFGKSKMAAFERYFIDASETHIEVGNPYYAWIDQRETCVRILEEFGLNPQTSRIINGHVPVRTLEGESPVKGGGLLFVIDGGISKAYQGKTGIGGYTLLSTSHELALAEHVPFFTARHEAFGKPPTVTIAEKFPRRLRVHDTDSGKRNIQRIEELKQLISAYRSGTIHEKTLSELW